ncbi:MAG TPA: hypothetical protein PLO23_01035 [Alphaproteobacteria bacterium]|nr:hypothetical protein [Alphaproteobacteria bacterium]
MLRLGAVSAAVVGLADPRFDSDPVLERGEGPVVLVVDNDWSATGKAELIKSRIETVLETAARQGRPVALIGTAPETTEGVKVQNYMSADDALKALPAFKTYPWNADRKGTEDALQDFKGSGASVVWFSNGITDTRTPDFIRSLEGVGSVSVFESAPEGAAKLLSLAPEDNENNLALAAHRLHAGPSETVSLLALNGAGEILAQKDATFEEGSLTAKASFEIPLALRRQIVKMSIAGQDHAGAQVLLDESGRRRSVGLLGAPGEAGLFDDAYYIKPAIRHYTDVVTGSASEILKQPVSALIMTDGAVLSEEDETQIQDWVKNGGLLLRFAGPRLAAQPDTALTPLPLRRGAEAMQGAFSGAGSSALAPFEEDSPLANLAVPENLRIKTRVMPESSALLEGTEAWASFEDGTPFITAKRDGKGMQILVHTAANMDWSNLPLSGDFFLGTIRAAIAQSKNAQAQGEIQNPLPALNVLSAKGRLSVPDRGNIRLTREALAGAAVTAASPPGFYGEGADSKLAHNIYRAFEEYKALDLPALKSEGTKSFTLSEGENSRLLMGLLLALGLGLLTADGIARLKQNNALPKLREPSHG